MATACDRAKHSVEGRKVFFVGNTRFFVYIVNLRHTALALNIYKSV